MKLKNIAKGILALSFLAPAVPAMAQDDNIIVRGNIIDWYYYGKDYTGGSSKEGWNQMPTGGYGTPANYGLFEICVNPNLEKEDKFVGMDFIMRNHICYGNAGGVYTGDAFYSFFFHETEDSQMNNEESGSEEYEILVRKWDIENNKYTTVGKLPFQPTDLTYDPVNDKVYGMFRIYSEEGDYCYELCELNMEDFSVRQISHAQFDYFYEPRAIAINSKGDIYGINQRGVVIRFNKDNGMYREVGNIGFRTQEKMMSAAFDFRTDKLYWLGYKNDGKKDSAVTDGTNNTMTIAEGGRDTGLYEIDTKTGKATLLSNCELKEFDMETMKLNWCGKVVLTGMWIDGSFEKKEHDLKVDAANIPTQIAVGAETELAFKVKNIGTKTVAEDDWSVELYANNEKVATKSGRDLAPSEVREVKFKYTAPESMDGQKVALVAKVIYAADEVTVNNQTNEINVSIGTSVTAIENLTAAKPQNHTTAVYNLAGQKVNAKYKGVVVRNGKKFVK